MRVENACIRKNIFCLTLITILFFPFYAVSVQTDGPVLVSGIDPDFHPCNTPDNLWPQPYVAGFMTHSWFLLGGEGQARGVRVTVTFEGTNLSVIQSDNALGSGICAQGPDERNPAPSIRVDWGYSLLLVLNGSWSYPYIEGVVWRCWEWGRNGGWPIFEQPAVDLVSSWIWYYPTVLTVDSTVTLSMVWSLDPNTLNYFATIDGIQFSLYSYTPGTGDSTQSPYFMTGYCERYWGPIYLGEWVKFFQFPGAWSIYQINSAGWRSRVSNPCYKSCSSSGNWLEADWAYSVHGRHAFLDNTVGWGGADNDFVGACFYSKVVEFFYSNSIVLQEYELLWCPPPACPYVCTWDGQHYVIDNNILPRSEKYPGVDVDDHYRLEQPLLPTYAGRCFSLYSLQVQEFEYEHDYIDHVGLFAVDHLIDTKIAISPTGEILTYRNPSPPNSCVDDHGVDRLSEVQFGDGNVSDPQTYFYGEEGDYLIVNFGNVSSDNAKLVIRSDMKCRDLDAGCCIEVQVLNGTQFDTVAVIAPRAYWATEAVNLAPYVVEGRELIVKLFWTLPHRLDYVGLDTTPEEDYSLRNATLVSAVHSEEGNVLSELASDDQVYTEIVPGQSIQLTFLMQNSAHEQETFVFCSNGHYDPIA